MHVSVLLVIERNDFLASRRKKNERGNQYQSERDSRKDDNRHEVGPFGMILFIYGGWSIHAM